MVSWFLGAIQTIPPDVVIHRGWKKVVRRATKPQPPSDSRSGDCHWNNLQKTDVAPVVETKSGRARCPRAAHDHDPGVTREQFGPIPSADVLVLVGAEQQPQ